MKTTIVILLSVTVLLVLGACSFDVTESIMEPRTLPAEKAEDVAGNNLSFPVIWSDGVALPLRGEFGVTQLEGTFTEIDGIPVYHQQDAGNLWQAQSVDGLTSPWHVDWVDWGDNLEARSWPLRAKIRVETVLIQDLITPLTGFEMAWVSGLGIDEMWGTTGATYDSYQATVYSHNARLTIQKVPDDEAVALVWNDVQRCWGRADGEVLPAPLYNSVVYETTEGPTSGYSAEINVKGKVIYGMLWDTRELAYGAGRYRLTFSLDDDGMYGLNTYFNESSRVFVAEAETETTAEDGDGSDSGAPSGGVGRIDPVNNLTYLDMVLTQGGDGGGGGNRDDWPGGGGGGNGHGGGN